MTKVSILIPCYNADAFIEQAIESALAQTITDKEVIVIDDGSTDRSLDRILRFGSAIRVESGPNRGGTRTRNRLLSMAHGEWVQYLDADDFLLPDKIEQQLHEGSSDSDVLYGPVTIHQSNSQKRTLLPIPEQDDPWQLLIRWQLPQTGGSLWKAEKLRSVGGWNDAQPVCQEHELYLRMLEAGMIFERTNASGAIYRIWSEETVCRRNPLATFEMKMKIVSRVETVLRNRQQLDDERKTCLAHARLECARAVYNLDPDFALSLSLEAERISPGYVPQVSEAFPSIYRIIYRILGFRSAEMIAGLKRKLAGPHHSSEHQ